MWLKYFIIGPLNEHDYYSTRENTESQSTIDSQEEAHIDGFQVFCCFSYDKNNLIEKFTFENLYKGGQLFYSVK